ncbi:glycosyltransferase family 8 protein [Campylobacter sp. LR264d]|uniref:glycosyltransferase family 8 protein n=1 Tax=Campylobacter sp. LR264d TaxID=2593544 RepID=UPI0012393105|nr:glycosyltransferase family 8 protein [Campylobacter sp. LR264d]KAA6233739.1 glycosyltransferase family 8 protein [Campylobacter sp. LR264d]
MMNIFFNADENYIKYLAVLITSIVKNTDSKKSFKEFCEKPAFKANKDSFLSSYENVNFEILSDEDKKEGYIFHILTNFISDETRDKLLLTCQNLNALYPCEVRIHLIDDNEFKGFKKTGAARENYLPYYRLKAMSFVDKNVSKVLYLDVDMLVFCDLRELFAIDLKNYIVAAVNDCGSKKRTMCFMENGKVNNYIFDKNYFNSGFLFINVDEYKKFNIEEKCIQIAKNMISSKTADQNLLNAAIASDKILNLSFSWDFMVIALAFTICKDESQNRLQYTRAEFMQSIKDIKIFHYGEKPWKFLKSFIDIKGNNINDYWWQMVEQTPAFKNELLKEKESIKYYLILASLGFESLNLIKKFRIFSINKLIKDESKDLERIERLKQIKDDDFSIYIILGEMINHARKSKKDGFSVFLKGIKALYLFNKYSTQKFIKKLK